MSGLKIQASRHPRTGKAYILEAKLPTSYKGKNIEILIEGNVVSVLVDGNGTGKTFERSVPLIQVLYHAYGWIEAQAV